MAPSCPKSNPKMKRWYTSRYGEYKEILGVTPDGKLVENVFKPETTPFPDGDLIDSLHGYLDLGWKYPDMFTEQEIQELKDAGYDLNPENWAAVVCIYLPFIHFIYLPKGWYL